jgi:hypothetical protein
MRHAATVCRTYWIDNVMTMALHRMQGIDGVPKISQDYNPATWMLEVTNVAVENRTGQDFAALYAASDMHKCASTLLPPLHRELSEVKPLGEP